MNILNIIILVFIFLNKSLNENPKNIAIIKFKTFYPNTLNTLENDYEFGGKDYIKSIVLSQIYLELEIYNNKSGTTQILNTFTDLITKSFSFISSDKIYSSNENNTLCNYNISLSNSYNIDSNSKTINEIFKIYSDTLLTKYNYIPLNCYHKDLNDSICGKIGVDLMIRIGTDETNFIPQIFDYLDTSDKSYAFKYSSTSNDEGIFMIGDIANSLLQEYNDSELISFFSKTSGWEITMDSIILEGQNISSNDIYDYVDVTISPEYEGLVFSELYIDILNKIYFDEYFKKDICKTETFFSNPYYIIISCDGYEFGKEDIKKFPKITFTRFKLGINFTFENEELFYYRDNKYYFKIYKISGKLKRFIFGRMFLKKYFTIYDADKKQISFYKKIVKNLEEENDKIDNYKKTKWIFISLLLLFLIIIVLAIGVFIGKEIYKERKKLANELSDNYLYQPNKNEEDETLYKESKEEK